MLYLWTQNYSQIIGTCPSHHGQLISQKLGLNPPPPPLRYYEHLNLTLNILNINITTKLLYRVSQQSGALLKTLSFVTASN